MANRRRHYSKPSRGKRHDQRAAMRKKILDAGSKAPNRIEKLEAEIEELKSQLLDPSLSNLRKAETERQIAVARESIDYHRGNIKIAAELQAKLDAYKASRS